ncbi:MAG: hypothetical protein ABI758_04965 [Candidatus Woesebacteria bacterium]
MALKVHQIESVEILKHSGGREKDRFKIHYIPTNGERAIPIIVPAGNKGNLTLRALADGRYPVKDYEVEIEETGHIGNAASMYLLRNGKRI